MKIARYSLLIVSCAAISACVHSPVPHTCTVVDNHGVSWTIGQDYVTCRTAVQTCRQWHYLHGQHYYYCKLQWIN